jgi:hypothetical protein
VKINPSYRAVLLSILSGSYTPYDVREFVRSCYALALPLIRKRIIQGRINLESLGLKQPDLIYDCIADLFVRDAKGRFTEIEQFFRKELAEPEQSSDALLFDTLRRIVFGRVNNNLIRIHSEVDPAFGKILHNLDVALTRTRFFEKYVRFGETSLACSEVDLLLDRPPAPFEYLRERLSRVVLVHDSLPVILEKLRGSLEDQEDYQRVVPFLWVVSVLKDIYALGSEADTTERMTAIERVEVEEGLKLVEDACLSIRRELRPHYVESGKTTEELFDAYLRTTFEILSDAIGAGRDGQRHFFEYLSERMPAITREEYVNRHKPVLEYFVKCAKSKVKAELKKQESAG